jgi:hypothetical protein
MYQALHKQLLLLIFLIDRQIVFYYSQMFLMTNLFHPILGIFVFYLVEKERL